MDSRVAIQSFFNNPVQSEEDIGRLNINVHEINRILNKYDFAIKTNRYLDKVVYVLINLSAAPNMTFYNPNELAYIKQVVNVLADAPAEGTSLLNLPSKLSKVKCQSLLSQLSNSKWIETFDNKFHLSLRALLELHSIIEPNECHLCKTIISVDMLEVDDKLYHRFCHEQFTR